MDFTCNDFCGQLLLLLLLLRLFVSPGLYLRRFASACLFHRLKQILFAINAFFNVQPIRSPASIMTCRKPPFSLCTLWCFRCFCYLQMHNALTLQPVRRLCWEFSKLPFPIDVHQDPFRNAFRHNDNIRS